ncbi:MAG: aliphatic sulfonate ABC transporter substrate-binding protein [Butyrivibrio sp.]|nr:aliphatic sulfonate ABC transporter substrate-binding protein [Butyrivibrio sp.]
MKKKAYIFSLLCLLILLLCACGETYRKRTHDDVVTIAIQPSAAFIPLYIAKEKRWIEDAIEPNGFKVEWKTFESGPPINESLLAGESDVGVLGDVPTVSVCVPGNKVIMIATAAQAADSYAILVPSDSDITCAEDLKGKKIGATFGSTAHNMAEKYMNTAGLSVDDVEIVNLSTADAASALKNKEVDAVSIWEPSVTRLTASGEIKILAEGSDCHLAGTNAIVVREDFATRHPEIVTKILEQYKKAAEFIPDMDYGTKAFLADGLSVDINQLDSIIPKFRYTVIITKEDTDALNDTIRFLNNKNLLRMNYDITQRCNSSYYPGF